MRQILLGVLERLTVPKAGPAGRLRPLFQLSQDKTCWLPLDEDFPNSGLVSWWQPGSDASSYKVCHFQIEPSPTYDPDNTNHDYFRVKGAPFPAVELVELKDADDPEDVRQLLILEGLSPNVCATRRVVIRDRSGSLIGPIDLVLRESRLFLSETRLDVPVPLSEPRGELALASWEAHRFLAPEGWARKVGEVDFSRDGVFLKRVLRDLRNFAPSVIHNAKLTEKLISEYCAAIETASLTQVQEQRLRRLRRIAQQSKNNVSIAEDALAELLSLQPVKDVISKAKEDAGEKAVREIRSSLTELDEKRSSLENQIDALNAELDGRRNELTSLEQQNAAAIANFSDRIHDKFQEVTRDASSFLAEIAFLRAALQGSGSNSSHHTNGAQLLPRCPVESVSASKMTLVVCDRFRNAGFSCRTGGLLLASLASGFVPILHGVMANDALEIFAECLFGGRVYRLTLHPALSSPGDLLKLPVITERASIPLEDLVAFGHQRQELSLVVLENLNLSQIDSVILPLLRRYSDQQIMRYSSMSPTSYPRPYGVWPSNFLIAGLLIDSPLTLPLSRELWSHATLVDASTSGATSTGVTNCVAGSSPLSDVSNEEWMQWQNSAAENEVTDTVVFATFINRQIQTSATFKRLLRRLAALLDVADTVEGSDKRVGLLAETAVIPYLISRGIDVRATLERSPVEIFEEQDLIDKLTTLFEKWGIDVA